MSSTGDLVRKNLPTLAEPADPVKDAKRQDDEPNNVLQNTLKIEWESDDENGIHTVLMNGRLKFQILEEVSEKGEIILRSSLFRSPQEELKDAISIACKNAVSRAFTAKWNELFPPEVRERAKREKISDKADRLEARANAMELIVAEMSSSMIEGRPINFELFDELGIDPAAFGLTRPNAE